MSTPQSVRTVFRDDSDIAALLLQKSVIFNPSLRKNWSVRTKVHEAEVHVYKEVKGLMDVIKAGLDG
ncbi:hypothetical protein ACS0TY_000745 [Phlomoides rotata]